MNALKKFLLDDSGAAGVEYGLLVALIAALIVTVALPLGTTLQTAFCTVLNAIPGHDVSADCP